MLSAKYLREEKFLKVQQKINDLSIWKGLLWTREIFEKVCYQKVGDGNNISPFTDPWIPSLPAQRVPSQAINIQPSNDARAFSLT